MAALLEWLTTDWVAFLAAPLALGLAMELLQILVKREGLQLLDRIGDLASYATVPALAYGLGFDRFYPILFVFGIYAGARLVELRRLPDWEELTHDTSHSAQGALVTLLLLAIGMR